MNGLRVLIAEDYEDMRAIVVALLSSEFQVISAVGDGAQLVQAAVFLQPDVIVSDISMPLMDGFSAQSELRSKGMECPFVFITVMDLKDLVSDPVQGAVAYVHKADLFSELKDAIRAVALGNSYVSRKFQEKLGGQ